MLCDKLDYFQNAAENSETLAVANAVATLSNYRGPKAAEADDKVQKVYEFLCTAVGTAPGTGTSFHLAVQHSNTKDDVSPTEAIAVDIPRAEMVAGASWKIRLPYGMKKWKRVSIQGSSGMTGAFSMQVRVIEG